MGLTEESSPIQEQDGQLLTGPPLQHLELPHFIEKTQTQDNFGQFGKFS